MIGSIQAFGFLEIARNPNKNVHYPADVLAGALIGIMAGWIGYMLRASNFYST